MARYIDVAETAKLIRSTLKVKFPSVKFSVKSSRYSGGASISVKYVDGPAVADVRAVTSPFEGAGFDGMIDMKYHKSSILLKDGTVVFGSSPGTVGSRGVYGAYETELPEGAEKVSFGSDYVHVYREYSDAFLEARVNEYKAEHGDGKYVFFKPSSKQSWGTAGPSIDIRPWDNNISVRVGRYVEGYNAVNSGA